MFAVYCTGARTLAIPGARISDTGLHALARASHALTHLDLSSCPGLTSGALAAVAASCTRLVSLNLATTNADNDLLVALAAGCKSLVSVRVPWCRGVGDGGVLAVVEGCPALRRLDTAGNLITDAVLGPMGRLARVDVGRCRLLKHPGFVSCFGAARTTPLLEFRATSAVGVTDDTLMVSGCTLPLMQTLVPAVT
jgi:hypothetical protein